MSARSIARRSGQVLGFLVLTANCSSPEPGGGSAPPATASAPQVPPVDAAATSTAPAPTTTTPTASATQRSRRDPPPRTVLPNPKPLQRPKDLALGPLFVGRQPRTVKFDGMPEHQPYVSEDGSTVVWVEGRGGDVGTFLIIRTVDDPAKDVFLAMNGPDACGHVSSVVCERLAQQSEREINTALRKHRWRQFQEYYPTVREWYDQCPAMWHVEFSIPPYQFLFDTPHLGIRGVADVEVPPKWYCEEIAKKEEREENYNKPYISRIGIAEKQRVMFIQADGCQKFGCESNPYFEFIRLPK